MSFNLNLFLSFLCAAYFFYNYTGLQRGRVSAYFIAFLLSTAIGVLAFMFLTLIAFCESLGISIILLITACGIIFCILGALLTLKDEGLVETLNNLFTGTFLMLLIGGAFYALLWFWNTFYV